MKKMLKFFPSIATIAHVVLHDLNLHFQGQTVSCYALAIEKSAGSGFPQQICLDSHDPCRGVTLVIFLYSNLFNCFVCYSVSLHDKFPSIFCDYCKTYLTIKVIYTVNIHYSMFVKG